MTLVEDDDTGNGFEYESEDASLDGSEEEQSLENFGKYIDHIRELRNKVPPLPDTVKLLECENGTKVYLIGTAHFSEESINDVNNIMDKVHPDFVFLELCESRCHVLTMDEERIKKEAENNNIMDFIRKCGLINGLFQYLLLRMNAHIVKSLEMAPGGEFRAAAKKAAQQPHCHILLGDRPISITFQRTLNRLGLWTRIKFFYALLTSFEPITKEMIEEMKKMDFLEKLLLEMANESPEVIRVVLDERDQYMTRSLWECTQLVSTNPPESTGRSNSIENEEETSVVRRRNPSGDRDAPSDRAKNENETHPHGSIDYSKSCCRHWPSQAVLPRTIVAVVGIGHVIGICRYWGSASTLERKELVTMLEPPLSWKIFKWTLRAVMLSAVLGCSYLFLRGSFRLCAWAWNKLL